MTDTLFPNDKPKKKRRAEIMRLIEKRWGHYSVEDQERLARMIENPKKKRAVDWQVIGPILLDRVRNLLAAVANVDVVGDEESWEQLKLYATDTYEVVCKIEPVELPFGSKDDAR